MKHGKHKSLCLIVIIIIIIIIIIIAAIVVFLSYAAPKQSELVNDRQTLTCLTVTCATAISLVT
jgi:uncharacterized protein YpmB